MELDTPAIPVTVETMPETELQPVLQKSAGQLPHRPKQAGPAPRKAEPQGSLFRVVWRWHFYAGVFVTPFLLTLAITGGLYIFKSEIESICRPDLLHVQPAGEIQSYQAQLDAAAAAYPDFQIQSLAVRPEPTRTTAIEMRKRQPAGAAPAAGERPRFDPSSRMTAFVNPYTGEITGHLNAQNDSLTPFFNFVLRIHRNLFIGTTGRVMTELATSWTVILILTGVYLWLPKNWSKPAGVWTPRFGKKAYTLLRDLHAIAGVYLFPIALTIAVTGMFYTFAVGKVIHDVAHHFMEDPEEQPAAAQAKAAAGKEGSQKAVAAASSTGERKGESGRGADNRPAAPPAPVPLGVSVDSIVQGIQKEYPGQIVTLTLGSGRRGQTDSTSLQAGAGNDYNNTYGRLVFNSLTLNRSNGEILTRKPLSEGGHFWHGWTYPLHVGSFFGPTTKVLWLLACFVLAALPVTGLWMWWERRPKGKSGLPRRQAVRLPVWLIVLIGLTCILLPIAGASVLLVLLLEGLVRLWQMFRRRRQPAIV